MAKAKTRKVGYDRSATLEEGIWTWEISTPTKTTLLTLVFYYREGHGGINCSIEIDGTEYPCVYARDLKEAGFFAEGFAAGWSAFSRYGESMGREADNG